MNGIKFRATSNTFTIPYSDHPLMESDSELQFGSQYMYYEIPYSDHPCEQRTRILIKGMTSIEGLSS